jgi:hypothetical protein
MTKMFHFCPPTIPAASRPAKGLGKETMPTQAVCCSAGRLRQTLLHPPDESASRQNSRGKPRPYLGQYRLPRRTPSQEQAPVLRGPLRQRSHKIASHPYRELMIANAKSSCYTIFQGQEWGTNE